MPSGNIIDTVGIDVNKLDVFDSSNFDVDIRSDAYGRTRVYGTLLDSYSWYYDIDCMIKIDLDGHGASLDDLSISYNNTVLNSLDTYFAYTSGEKIYFDTSSKYTYFIEVFFRIVNKETGQVVHIRSIDFNFGNLGHGYNEERFYEDDNAVDNGNYSLSDRGSDLSNYENWKIDDYYDLVSTDNFIWQFFKAILFGLPSWITTPLYILIFGVVIITLYRFIRGA